MPGQTPALFNSTTVLIVAGICVIAGIGALVLAIDAGRTIDATIIGVLLLPAVVLFAAATWVRRG